MELLLVSGAAASAVGRKFSVSPHALGRHLRAHVSQERRAQLIAGPIKLHELAERAAESDLSLRDYLALVRSTVLAQMLAAAEASDRQGVALLAGRVTECLRLEAQVNDELRPVLSQVNNNTVINNFYASPEFAQFMDDLVRALGPFPEAREAVLAVFERRLAPAAQHPALEHQPDVKETAAAAV
jgi:hypothetical protein